MSDDTSEDAPAVSSRERAHLERAHHEICTALTVLRSNVELVRIDLRKEPHPKGRVTVHDHLGELDAAVDRLQTLVLTIRTWRGAEATGRPRRGAVQPAPREASLHP